MAARCSDADPSLVFSSRTRFLDVYNEPTKKILSPIRNYENSPLVSLEESVSKLEHFIKDLKIDVWVAKQNSEEEVGNDHLKHDERASIHLYTMCPSVPRLLNEALRIDNRECLLPWFIFFRLFLTALWKLKSVQCTVWRGMKGNYGADLRKGQKFFWWGFSSCTLSRKVFEKEQFLGNYGVGTLFKIECTHGKNITNYSYYENEEEVLLLPCSYFEVLNVGLEENDMCIIHVKQLPPPVSLIESPVPLIEPPVPLTESPVTSVSLIEPLVPLIEPPVPLIEPLMSLIEPPVSLAEPSVTLIEPPLAIDSPGESKVFSTVSSEQLSRSQRRRQKQKQKRVVKIADALTTTTNEVKETITPKITQQQSSLGESILSKEQKTTPEQSVSIKSNVFLETNKSTDQVICTEPKLSSEASMATISKLHPKTTTVTINFDRLNTRPRKSITAINCLRIATDNQYFLVCPKDRLCLLDREGNEHWSIKRNFDVDDLCYSTYLKQFLILADYDLYSLDVERSTKLRKEITQFARNMDECSCHENLFLVIKDYGGHIIEVWDMESNWKLKKTYQQPISCQEGQGICTIRFSSDGNYLGVTLTEPFTEKAFFQLRNSKDMKILTKVELPFYEGYCNHYILSLPNNEFLVYKYSEKLMFLIDSNGQRKKAIQYTKGVCTMAIINNCFVIRTNRPDELHFYDL
ncbi:unnamed protein product [Rotaria magnacalcarata]|uniref:NAD(P)(+)--arginine ADP-ribosyltransferase n=1 Tax=Rotaria magnacalcarata TaxID=392030 RepID=A0A814JT58_9BILA|nr:unnamed protein product [Rotaria magnacalcarata]CAF3906157.1 unnamed protein product [Rotaria magnacalcarata]